MNKNRDVVIDKQKSLHYIASKMVAPIIGATFITSTPALAQIQPDDTLGNESSRITSGVNADLITDGARRGSSLFHSFSEFNVNNGQRVYFANPSGVNNIFSRVTGSNVSHILGTLGVNGAANLYLLNPNGIIFGKDVQLDIQGAFFATTANSFTFPDGSEFSATNPQMPLFTTSVPVGVQFGSQPGDIRSRGNLTIQNDLTLKGGKLDLQGEVRSGGNVTLTATENINFDLISTTPNSGNAGSVALEAKEDIIGNLISTASFKSQSNNGSSGNISLKSEHGKVVIRGGIYKGTNTVDDKDRYFALGAFVDSYSLDTNYKAGNITIQANKDIDIGSNLKSPPSGAINASVLAKGEKANAGNSGTIQLTSTSGNITVNGGIFTNSTVDKGNGNSGNSGDIILTAKQGAITVYPNGGGAIVTKSIANDHGTTGNAGSIKLEGRKITIKGREKRENPSNPDVTTQSNQTGNSGSIRFISQTPLTLQGLIIGTDAKDGQGGDVIINAPSITLNNTQIIAKTSGTGIPGDILLTADRDVSLVNNSQITSDAQNDKYEDFKIQIYSESGSVYMNGATVKADNRGSGLAGIIYMNAPDSIQIINNSQINADGNFGIILVGYSPSSSFVAQTIEINNSHLTTTDKNESQTNTSNTSKAGAIIIQSNESASITNNSNLKAVTSGDGKGGNILIETSSLSISDSSTLDTSTEGKDNAGNVYINARDSLTLQTQASISSIATATSQGSAGTIEITAPKITLRSGAKIEVNSTNTVSTSKAGNITFLDNQYLKLDDNASITAKNDGGNGGDITINTQNLLLRRNSEISTTAGSENTRGNGGEITINAENGFVIAVPSENSDIIANAFGGTGGKININASRVFGLQTRGKLNTEQLQGIRNNNSSEISASSDIGDDGQVAIQTLSVDPSQGLVQLPTDLVDLTGLIAQGCGNNNTVAKGQSAFVVTGRGGLPPSPDDALSAGTLPTEWVTRDTNIYSNNSEETQITQKQEIDSSPLVEAVGMVRNGEGDIVLTAQPVTARGFQSGLPSLGCNVAQREGK
ncbi:filamentous hemagglutinin N-terminal domain-containing protein [Anabaena azotica]|uniref:two-partner secretion domain-containing protein n=1 Tax=Anabaena azotica TaxID=197653 RepID=UPI0039A702B4